ncbi:type I glyceraldehyde-3-phosphate dehydrogenase [Panacibacter ginsenosidivorans]|uniref:Type I glyceraldehyde-3-phosphate dehydrogenase n=1 Tax=Panacibacter ginsenosidivorans TaxID=1813871 RepID=A0A5B8VDI5_9BACT|nr:glyceraldehyde 3-phosphate dehydrogenase NAD-binding domain-containing protein [Panacibacter ginsenosidivorans]QEC69115.1 type I glyceraldehyde-3-phosphate dehydrogenase [Panacibacter ginsenosidivorans]
MRIAINGMGRIGRLLFRRLINDPAFTLVAVNDIMETENLLYLLKYDSLYGKFQGDISLSDNAIVAGDKKVIVLQHEYPSQLSWKDLDIDIVLECSGKFTNKAGASEHLKAGAKKVLLSTTGSPDIPLMIYGFNHHRLDNTIEIVSPGGCMTNCSTHILYILNSIGIESAQINILHSYTSRQELVDTAHKQFRRGRAAAESIIPVEIDLAQSLERLLPLQDKIAAVSVRVPVTNGAMADFTVQLKEPAAKEEINLLFKKAAENEYKNIIAYSEDPLVSADIKGDTHSCIIDGTLTSVAVKQVKIIAWFDNEYGYTSRIIDWLLYWKKLMS